ncbi:unnamed protein product [Notodromas monacha]|uniref:RING-type domain-containing protein n=1 Tax=Notodromas monacha TaxID=399045 RepID=A0A7R9GGT0_9CRUS|nr:unnamed protein product [Notodromas monacha]CAG0920545.1 unnamed protein product [Notodromas monacha]
MDDATRAESLIREVLPLLAKAVIPLRFAPFNINCHQANDATEQPTLTRRAGSVQPNRSGANQTNVTVTKFRPRNFEPRVVREIPIRRLNSTESASASTTWIGPASATSAEEARRSARVENRKSYPKYSKPPQPQRATTYFVPPQQTSDPLFAAFASASPHSRPNSFSHTSSAKVIFHPIFQTGVPHSDTFSSSHAPRPDDDDGLPPVIITEITEEEAEEIARKQRRERRKPEEGKKGESANEEYTTKSTPVRVRCELCLASLRIGSGNDMALSCNHLFHSQCILEWLSRKSTCPVCQELIIKD